MNFTGRLGRLAYVIRLCLIAILYALGAMLINLGSGDLSLWVVLCLFAGSSFLLVAFLMWWFSNVFRLHDINLSGWWFLLVCLMPALAFVLCLWPGTRGVNRFGLPAR